MNKQDKLELSYHLRKSIVLGKLARHLGFPRMLYHQDYFCEVLFTFKSLAEPQRQVYRQLDKGDVTTVRFPDGHLLEMKRSIVFTDVRDPGQGDNEWRGTYLNMPLEIIDWLLDAQVVLEKSPQ